jgi:hypothetical protein
MSHILEHELPLQFAGLLSLFLTAFFGGPKQLRPPRVDLGGPFWRCQARVLEPTF